jgi:hypothetical protein
VSHFAKIEVIFRQEHEKELVASLRKVLYDHEIGVYPEGRALLGYHGDDRSKKGIASPDYAPPCQVVVHKQGASNDIGYQRIGDGRYTAYISEFDQRNFFTQAKQDKVLQEYTLDVSQKTLTASGYGGFKRIQLPDGSIRLEATAFR